MVTQVQPVYRYCLNEANVIVWVDHWWLAFAQENNAAGLTEDSVVGRDLWQFIADEPTRILYREINDHVRAFGNPIEVPFRCDSPTLQRYMQLTISKQGSDKLLYESVLIRAVPQTRLAVLDCQQKRSNAFLTMCSFCKRSLIETSGWLAMEDVSLNLRMYDKQTVPELRYTVCPDCSNGLGYLERSSPGAANRDRTLSKGSST
jgi:hypothetical protein